MTSINFSHLMLVVVLCCIQIYWVNATYGTATFCSKGFQVAIPNVKEKEPQFVAYRVSVNVCDEALNSNDIRVLRSPQWEEWIYKDCTRELQPGDSIKVTYIVEYSATKRESYQDEFVVEKLEESCLC